MSVCIALFTASSNAGESSTPDSQGCNEGTWRCKEIVLDKEDPFYIQIKNRRVQLTHGTKLDVEIVMSGDYSAIIRICEGKGDFTHAISREQITVEKGKVMDVIRLTRAITIVLKTK